VSEKYPKIWVKYESVEYKYKDIDPLLNGIDGEGWFYFKQNNDNYAICYFIGGRNYHWLLYDFQTKKWTELLSFINPTHYRENYAEREAYRKEDELMYGNARHRFEEEEKRIIDPLRAREINFYSGFPNSWRMEDRNGLYITPPEAEFFDFESEGSYRSEFRTGGGGWWGGEARTKREYKKFVGTITMYFKSKPVLQDTEEQMGTHIAVSYDFRTAFYSHRSADSIKFDLLDLTELWNDEENPNAPTPPVTEMGNQPADAR
jgi:hypothetical protein